MTLGEDKVKIIVEGKDKASGVFGKVGGSLERLGGIAKITGGILLGGLAAGIAGVGAVLGTTIPMAVDFQSAVVDLRIAAGDSGLSLQTLQDAAIAVGGDTRLLGVSASGAAEAMTGLYKAGLSTVEIFGNVQNYMAGTAELGGALRASIDAAAATELDMVQASDLAAVALATFGAEMETETERAGFINDALDHMVRSANASVAEVSDLAASFKTVGPVAAGLGIPLDQLNQALAILSTRGIKGSAAGTALKSMLTNLQRPTEDVQEAYAELGVTMYDVNGQFVGLPNLIEQLSDALYGNSEIVVEVGGRTREQNELLDRAQSRYESLTKRIADHNAGIKIMSDTSLKKANQELANSVSIITELEAITGTATTSTKKLTEEERNLYIQTLAGTYGMNALNTLLAEGVEGWDAMGEAIGDAMGIQEQAALKAETFAGRMEALKGAMETVKIELGLKFLPVMTDLLNLFIERGIPILEGLVKPFEKLAEVITTIVDDFPFIISAFRYGYDEGGILQGVLEAIAEILDDFLPRDLMSKVYGFRDSILAVKDAILEFFDPVLEWIDHNIELKDLLITLGIILGGVLLSALWAIGSALAPVVLAFGALLLAVSTLRRAWEEDWNGMRTKLTEAWEGTIRPALETLWAWLQEKIPAAIETLKTFWEEKLKPALETVWAFIVEDVIPALRNVRNWLKIHIPIAIEKCKEFWEEHLKPALETVWDFMVENVIPAHEDVYDWLIAKIPVAIAVSKYFLEEVLKPALETVWEYLTEYFIPAHVELYEWLKEKIPEAIETNRSFWIETLRPALVDIWEYLEGSIIKVLLALANVMDAIVDTQITITAMLWRNLFLPALAAVWGFIVVWLRPIFEWIVEFFTIDLDPALEVSAGWWDILKAALTPIKGLLQGIAQWLNNVADAIRRLPNSLPGWLTGESPSPFENSLRGIDDALAIVTPRLREFNQVARATGRTDVTLMTGGAGIQVNMPTTAGAQPGQAFGQPSEYHLHVYGRDADVLDDFDLLRSIAGA
jgi:TP901 family phage tail tape measure protein